MARRRRTPAGMESYEELARKAAILERELAVQRRALEQLKRMGAARHEVPQTSPPAVRKSA